MEKKSTLKKNKEGYGYKYTELAEINKYCEENKIRYYQEVETNEINQKDYIVTYLIEKTPPASLTETFCNPYTGKPLEEVFIVPSHKQTSNGQEGNLTRRNNPVSNSLVMLFRKLFKR